MKKEREDEEKKYNFTYIIFLSLTTVLSLQNNKIVADQMLCNGKANLCDRPYNKIAQINVHNATSTTKKDTFYIPRIIPCGTGETLTVYNEQKKQHELELKIIQQKLEGLYAYGK